MASSVSRYSDPIERALRDWEKELPDLDTTGLGVVGRISLLSKRLALQMQEILRPLGLEIWEYEVLSALRRQGQPYELAPKHLAEQALLTTGAITNRIDRLEGRGLVTRRRNPDDRRGLRIGLTDPGRQLVEAAARARMTGVREFVDNLTGTERKILEGLLRDLIIRGSQTTPG